MKKSPIALDIRRMADGSTDALSHFYQATAPTAYALALSILRNSDAAADAIQEAYLTAYESAADYCPKESALVWFFSMVYRQCSAQETIAAENIPAHFTPVAALACAGHVTARDIAKITGLSRREISSPKHLKENTDLTAYCQSILKMTPDLSQSIILSALLSSGRPPVSITSDIFEPIPKQPPVSRWKWLAYDLPVLALLVLVGFTIRNIIHIPKVPDIPVANTIYLDGVSGICLELDENDRVLDAWACDDVSKPLLQDLSLRFSPVDTAMGKIVDAMVSKGYLKEHPDALLLSVTPPASGEEEAGNTLLKYQKSLLDVLEQRNLPTVLLSQTLPIENRVTNIAETYQLSPGRAGLIHQFLSKLTPYTDPRVAVLAEKSPFYFYWLLALQSPTDVSQIHFSQTEKMSKYFSGEEILSRALYLLTHANVRQPGSSVSLSHVSVEADEMQTCYYLSLNLSENTYHLKVSAWTGYFLDCTRNGEPVSLDFYSNFAGLETMIEKEKAISLAIGAAGCDADSVVFCTAQRDWYGGLISSLYPSLDSSILDSSSSSLVPIESIPGKYKVTFYSKDMYTHYSVDVIVSSNSVLGITKTETPVLPGGISPRKAVSQAVAFTGWTEDTIVFVSYESNTTASEPYYVIHLQLVGCIGDYYVDMVNGKVSMLPRAAISKDQAIQIAASYFGLTPDSAVSSPQLSVTEDDAIYRVTFTAGTMGYRADVALSSGAVLQANTRLLISRERAYSLVEEAAGIRPGESIRGCEITDSEYIIQLYHDGSNYVSRVCRNTGVILYFDVRSEGESLTIPQWPAVMRTQEEALQLALEDAFASVDTVNQITVSNKGDFYSVSFIDFFRTKYTYSIFAVRGGNSPILSKRSGILYS